jgi:hypothetical protein
VKQGDPEADADSENMSDRSSAFEAVRFIDREYGFEKEKRIELE